MEHAHALTFATRSSPRDAARSNGVSPKSFFESTLTPSSRSSSSFSTSSFKVQLQMFCI